MSNIKKCLDTGKFWSFKDTKNYKNQLGIANNTNVVRTFIFSKTFLLKVKCRLTGEIKFVIPKKYTSQLWPRGDFFFSDTDIVEVINEA
jgi:hypothetical protein